MHRAYVACWVVGALCLTGCLPADTRPEPGRLYIEAEANELSLNGFTTYEGWTVHFERLLVGLGYASLETVPNWGDCDTYENADYDRLFDFTLPGRQKLGEVYGLGQCTVAFAMRSPSADSLLQHGVTAADRDLMRESAIEENSTLLPTDVPPPPRIAIYARGAATRGSETMRFDWKLLARDTLGYCGSFSGMMTTNLELSGRDDLRSVISFHGDELFRSQNETWALKFDAFASADINGDKVVTTDELDQQPIVILSEHHTDPVEMTLGQYLRDNALPRTVYFDGAACTRIEWEPMWGGGDGPF